MRHLILGALLSLASLQAQNIAGDWQGTLGEGTNDTLRLKLRIAKAGNAWTASLLKGGCRFARDSCIYRDIALSLEP